MWEDRENQIQSQDESESQRQLCDIAGDIYRDWKTMSPYARPYVDAMLSLGTMKDYYGLDSAKSVVLYFLSNASTWRGETAKRIKAELKAMMKGAK